MSAENFISVSVSPGSGSASPTKSTDQHVPVFRELSVRADARAAADLGALRDIEMDVRIELGRARMKLEDALKLSEGVVVELDRMAGDPVDVFVNDQLVARGEVVVIDDKFAVRLTEVSKSAEKEIGPLARPLNGGDA